MQEFDERDGVDIVQTSRREVENVVEKDVTRHIEGDSGECE